MDNKMQDPQTYTDWQTAFLICSIFTYLADITLDVILAVSFLTNQEFLNCILTVTMVLFPQIVTSFFSIRWHQIDGAMDKGIYIIHFASLGVVYRYLEVIKSGYKAQKTINVLDYQRFYQQQSDVCMLRLFDSFLESAPQLVFHLYLLILRDEWPTELVIWSGISAIGSMISLGWGIAAYSASTRMAHTKKGELSIMATILQTVWRSGMLSARIVSLVLLALCLHQWIIIVMIVHWFLMTLWVINQDTDFCTNVWEERLYNAVVGAIYCFCFFNLKEGRSRYRVLTFYSIIVTENIAFVILFYAQESTLDPSTHLVIGIGGFAIVAIGTILGIFSMLLYYGWFHPAGPIDCCVRVEIKDDSCMEKSCNNTSSGPDFEIQDYADQNQNKAIESPISTSGEPSRPTRKKRVQYSRSFKDSCPPSNRFTPRRVLLPKSPSSSSSDGAKTLTATAADSAYGTDSNRTASRSTASPREEQLDPNLDSSINRSGSSQAYNNETYMSVEKAEAAACGLSRTNETQSEISQVSADSRVTVIHKTPEKSEMVETQQPEKLLKRSPVLKDVTLEVPVQQKPKMALNAPLTIIIPNISHQAFAKTKSQSGADYTIPLEQLNPAGLADKLSTHDYENLALVNINRGTVGVTHWRTYSELAEGKHDESVAYERKKAAEASTLKHSCSDYSNYGSLQYYDIYPLSNDMKDQLYRSLTPCSTAATVASDSVTNISDSDTYEPIEVYSTDNNFSDAFNKQSSALPLTLIHHDGRNLVTKQVESVENLREALQNHEIFPMDDPEERGDLYLLAPMRLLSPILEESELDSTKHTDSTYQRRCSFASAAAQGHANPDRSLLSVISEILNTSLHKYADMPKKKTSTSENRVYSFPDGRFADSTDTTSSLVHTIDEIRNTSLCNLFSSSFSDLGSQDNLIEGKKHNVAVPQVPPRNDAASTIASKSSKAVPVRNNIAAMNTSVRSINSNTLVASPTLSQKTLTLEGENENVPQLPFKKRPLSTSIGSRKNIFELGGGGGGEENILNTPKRPVKKNVSLVPNPSQHHEVGLPEPKIVSRNREPLGQSSSQNNINSPLHPVCESFIPLSPSSKYETPTPPLRPNQFVRNSALTRPRRKFSTTSGKGQQQYEPEQKENLDLYQNISNNDLIFNDLSQISKSTSTPSFLDSRDFGNHPTPLTTTVGLRPDDKYENIQRGWATSSIRESHRALLNAQRNVVNRRSMSHIECFPAVLSPITNNKENVAISPVPRLGPKPLNYHHHASSLSPKSRIFDTRSKLK